MLALREGYKKKVDTSLSNVRLVPPRLSLENWLYLYNTLMENTFYLVSAFYAECFNKKIQFNAHIWTKSKFLGMSIGVHNIGQGKLWAILGRLQC